MIWIPFSSDMDKITDRRKQKIFHSDRNNTDDTVLSLKSLLEEYPQKFFKSEVRSSMHTELCRRTHE